MSDLIDLFTLAISQGQLSELHERLTCKRVPDRETVTDSRQNPRLDKKPALYVETTFRGLRA